MPTQRTGCKACGKRLQRPPRGRRTYCPACAAQRNAESTRRYLQRPEVKQRRRAWYKEYIKRPGVMRRIRARVEEYRKKPSVRRRIRELRLRDQNDPKKRAEKREYMREYMREYLEVPANRKKHNKLQREGAAEKRRQRSRFK